MPSKQTLLIFLILMLIASAILFSRMNKKSDFGNDPFTSPYTQTNSLEKIPETEIITVTEETVEVPIDGNSYLSNQTMTYQTYPYTTYTPPTSIPPASNTLVYPSDNSLGNRTCSPSRTRAMWVWDNDVITDSRNNYSKRTELLSFSSSRDINTLYVESYGIITESSSSRRNALAEFIRLAKEQCITVELLAGESEWYLPGNHDQVIRLAQKAVEFSNSISFKPTALHLDVEPYGYLGGSLWDANNGTNRGQILSDYISMLSKVKSALGGTLLLNVDVPAWYDSSSSLQGSGTAYFSHEIMKIVDVMTIMDYRDTAFGVDSSGNLISSKNDSSNAIYDLGYDEVQYANTLGKKVIIGVETKCFSDSDSAHITFCGTRTVGGQTLKKGSIFMETELTRVRNAFDQFASFGGTAIHHYDAYTILPSSY